MYLVQIPAGVKPLCVRGKVFELRNLGFLHHERDMSYITKGTGPTNQTKLAVILIGYITLISILFCILILFLWSWYVSAKGKEFYLGHTGISMSFLPVIALLSFVLGIHAYWWAFCHSYPFRVAFAGSFSTRMDHDDQKTVSGCCWFPKQYWRCWCLISMELFISTLSFDNQKNLSSAPNSFIPYKLDAPAVMQNVIHFFWRDDLGLPNCIGDCRKLWLHFIFFCFDFSDIL